MLGPPPPPDRLVDELEQGLRAIGEVVSTSLGAWAEAAHLQLVDAGVMLALSNLDRPTGAFELSAGGSVSLDAVYAALHRLTDRGYAHEEHGRYTLTDTGQVLIGALDRAFREGIQSYIAQLSPDQARRLESVLFSR